MRYHICITQFWDFKKWAVAQKRSSFKNFSQCKIFFWKQFTGQVFIWDTSELSSPTKSALKLRLKMAKNHDFSWFYYVKWLKTWGARQIGFHHSDFKIFFFLRPWAWVLMIFRGQTLGTQNFILGTPGTVGYWVYRMTDKWFYFLCLNIFFVSKRTVKKSF